MIRYNSNFALLLLFILGLSSCGINRTEIATLRPADIELSEKIVKIATVDRSLPSNEAVTVLEGIMTGEVIGQDKFARKNVFTSLNAIMQEQDRFELVISSMELPGSQSGARMLEPLNEKLVKGIAKKYNADAVLVLENFDSDARNTATDIIEWTATSTTGINPVSYPNNTRSGWRIYDGESGLVLDEFHTFFTKDGWWAYNNHPAFVDRRDALEAADMSAFQMAGRIIPVEVYFDRMYYRNSGMSNKALKKADDFVQARRMDKAAEIWYDLYNSPASKKTRGRAAFNMAVYYEKSGDIAEAVSWVEKSIDLGNKKAVTYGAVLSEMN